MVNCIWSTQFWKEKKSPSSEEEKDKNIYLAENVNVFKSKWALVDYIKTMSIQQDGIQWLHAVSDCINPLKSMWFKLQAKENEYIKKAKANVNFK